MQDDASIRRAVLFGVPGSHPVKAVELMLRYKRVRFRRIDFPTFLRRPLMRAIGFRSPTVPVALLDGRRVLTSIGIARALDEGQPQPPLYTGDERVEAAAQWADGALQQSVRQLSWWGVAHDDAGTASFLDDAKLGVPPAVVKRMLPLLLPLVRREMHADDAGLRRNLALLGEHLDRVDAMLAEGVIGGEQPNAADFLIAASVRLAMCFTPLRARIEARPAGRHALRICPDFVGEFTRPIPPAWVSW